MADITTWFQDHVPLAEFQKPNKSMISSLFHHYSINPSNPFQKPKSWHGFRLSQGGSWHGFPGEPPPTHFEELRSADGKDGGTCIGKHAKHRTHMGKNMGKHTKHGPSEFEDLSLLNLKSQERDVPEQLQRRPARTVGGGNKRRPKWMMSSDPQKDNG